MQYSCELNNTNDEIFAVDSFFPGLLTQDLEEKEIWIYFDIEEYEIVLDLLSFDQTDLRTLSDAFLYNFCPHALVDESGSRASWTVLPLSTREEFKCCCNFRVRYMY